jgi:hypothetical protein
MTVVRAVRHHATPYFFPNVVSCAPLSAMKIASRLAGSSRSHFR